MYQKKNIFRIHDPKEGTKKRRMTPRSVRAYINCIVSNVRYREEWKMVKNTFDGHSSIAIKIMVSHHIPSPIQKITYTIFTILLVREISIDLFFFVFLSIH